MSDSKKSFQIDIDVLNRVFELIPNIKELNSLDQLNKRYRQFTTIFLANFATWIHALPVRYTIRNFDTFFHLDTKSFASSIQFSSLTHFTCIELATTSVPYHVIRDLQE